MLYDIQSNGIDASEYTKKLIRTGTPTIDVIKFINDNRELELTNFYKKIRKSYNNKKSKLYYNIVRSDETDLADSTLTTLSALLTQIILYSQSIENQEMFLRHARCNEITKVLSLYFRDYDLTNCIKLLTLIKADIKALESISA